MIHVNDLKPEACELAFASETYMQISSIHTFGKSKCIIKTKFYVVLRHLVVSNILNVSNFQCKVTESARAL